MKNKYQNSVCKQGWLHKFIQVGLTKNGSLERCERCGLQMNFHMNAPNYLYLSFHIRSVLQSSDNLFKKEYPQIKV